MIDLSVIERFGLVLVRPGMVVLVAPVFGGTFAPMPVKVGLTALLAVTLAPAIGVPEILSDVSLAVIIARELAVGLCLGITVRALMNAAELGGYLSGHQIGFSYAATVDPATGARNSVLTSLYGMLALLTFFLVNGHHQVLRALALSYEGLPIGGGGMDASIVDGVRQVLALIFVVGVRLAAPIVLVLLIVELAVGLVSRSAPSLNFMVIGYPVRMIIGLLILAAMVGTVPEVVSSQVERTIRLGLDLAAAFR